MGASKRFKEARKRFGRFQKALGSSETFWDFQKDLGGSEKLGRFQKALGASFAC